MVMHWDYLNNDPRASWGKDQIGWMLSRITDSKQSASISKAIDTKFDEFDNQTVTMSERQFQLSFLAGLSAILRVFDVVSVVILVIMLLVIANTIAMSVRERTHEYGVLKAIGFPDNLISTLIIGEAALVAVVGGFVGVLLTFLLVNKGVGPVLEESMASLFPYFSTPPWVMLTALVAAAVIGAAAAALPGWRASRLKVTDALRRVN